MILPVLADGALTDQLPRALLALVGLIALMWAGAMLILLSLFSERAFEPGRGRVANAVAGLVTLAMAAAARPPPTTVGREAQRPWS